MGFSFGPGCTDLITCPDHLGKCPCLRSGYGYEYGPDPKLTIYHEYNPVSGPGLGPQ